jgi:eukaryotic-like serine/threonine-protein kinase
MMHVGKYRLLHKLATGGMAEVFLAKAEGPMGFEKTLVLKRILPHLAEDSDFVEMFLTEARLAAQLNHPNIVQMFDFGVVEGVYYLAMEHVDGPNLHVLLRRANALGLALSPVLCARLISAACEGLAFAHQFRDPTTGQQLGLIHRDISPDNLLLSRQGAVKVVDFGIAKAAGQGPRTQTGVLKGKLSYMPPEQLRGAPLDQRADVYALGLVFYELLTGRRPFEATTDEGIVQAILHEPAVPAVRYRPDLPSSVQQILERVLAKDREQRYPDCRAFQADLERFILSRGESVGVWQLAQLVAQVLEEAPSAAPPPSASPTTAVLAPPGAKPPAASTVVLRPPKPPAQGDPGEARGVPTRAHWRKRPALAVVGSVLLMAVGGYLSFRMQEATGVDAPGKGPPPPLEASNIASAPKVEIPAQKADEARQTEAPEGEPLGSASSDRSSTKLTRPMLRRPGATGKGTVAFRIRPYATVFLDGKALGQTPFAPVEVTEGWHTVRLINQELDKNVTQRIEVKANQSFVLKLNLDNG